MTECLVDVLPFVVHPAHIARRRGQDEVQKTTDALIGQVDALAKTKETEVMEV